MKQVGQVDVLSSIGMRGLACLETRDAIRRPGARLDLKSHPSLDYSSWPDFGLAAVARTELP